MTAAQLATLWGGCKDEVRQCSPVGGALWHVRELNHRCTVTITARSMIGHVHLRAHCPQVSVCPSTHFPSTLHGGLLKTTLLTVGSDPCFSRMVMREEAWLTLGCLRRAIWVWQVVLGPLGGPSPAGSLAPAPLLEPPIHLSE